jgi:hypothetical protein
VVERQPEKLKVVGSNPIPDNLLLLLFPINFLLLNDLFVFHITHSLVAIFTIFYVVLCCLLLITNSFGEHKSIILNFNLIFIFSKVLFSIKNILLKIVSLLSKSLYYNFTSKGSLK